MTNGIHRIGIVGATSLVGKELSEELQASLLASSDVVLLDDEEGGQLTTAGGEAAFIQKIESTSFERMDFVFFAGDASETKKHWQIARQAGASIVDLTYALEGERDVLIRSPLIEPGSTGLGKDKNKVPDLKTQAVVTAHPAAVMLALVASRLKANLTLTGIAATVMEPASEHGSPAMDELHQQTVSLFSFSSIPREQFDAQVAFNLLPALGSAGKIRLEETGQRIRDHYKILSAGELPSLSLQMVQAPVFHGYGVSVLVDMEQPATAKQLEVSLAGELIDVVNNTTDPPSNVSAAGQRNILVKISHDEGEGETSKRFWLWLATDNLKLATLNAISCALELKRLRPSSKVQ